MENWLEQGEDEQDLAFDGVDDAQMAGDSVGAHEGEEVGEAGDDCAEVGLRAAGVVFLPLREVLVCDRADLMSQ